MKRSFTKSWAVILTLLALTFSAIGVTPAHPVTFTVTNLNNGGAGSLRQAIIDANAAAGADTITFSVTVPAAITLISSLPNISDNLTINGPGADNLTISGDGTVPVFIVNSGVTFNLQNVTVDMGYSTTAGGAGLRNNGGAVYIANTIFSDNIVEGSAGGGIYNTGGGILNINNSTFSSNWADSGGGIYNASGGTLSVTNSAFVSNLVVGNGGGIYNDGVALDVTNSAFSFNNADSGGGIYTAGGTLNIISSTISVNGAAGFENVGAGGGIYIATGTVTITNSTLSVNSADAGGGIYVASGAVNITNNTIADNTAFDSTIGELVLGGDIDNRGGTVTLRNTIVANVFGQSCRGTIDDGSNNIDSGATCGLSASGSMSNTNPLLAEMADNGGHTETRALWASSPAIDRANPAFCTATDQRGISRPQDGDNNGTAVCDIGAFEARLFTLTVTGAGTGKGTVTSEGTSINCTIAAGTTSGDCSESLTDTWYTIMAYPTGGSTFDGWSGDCSGSDAGADVFLDTNRTCVATFNMRVFLPLVLR